MFYAVIPAGGSGTRLWPLSRAGHPKFLHALTGTSASLLQATVRRVAPLSGPERTFVVTGTAHAARVARQLPDLPESNILVEPSPRDSCAAIGLAAAVIARREPSALMGSFAADHLVADAGRFVEVVHQAMAGAADGFLMTVGITPTRPETGYGYLQCGDSIDGGPVRRVDEFKEKPAYDVAVSYLESGHYFWNASMFVWRVDVFLAELERQNPELHAGLTKIAEVWDDPRREEVLGDLWPTLPKISVDYAVMEGAAAVGRVATVPGTFGWNDIGDFDTLGDVLPADANGNVVLGASDPAGGGGHGSGPAGGDRGATARAGTLLDDCTGLVVVPGSGRLVAALGVRDLIVVDTDDAVLLCPRDRAQEVKRLVDQLRTDGKTTYL